jgi:hypothetical protein
MPRQLCPAGKLLDEWLREADISRLAFSKLIGAHGNLWRWMVGACAPSINYAAKIEAVTEIPARMWATDDDLRRVEVHDVTSIPMADM